jgi:uncharacterized protein YunC (DUF1805 family)
VSDYQPHVIELQNANIVVLKANRGYVMCGYLNLEAAEKMGDAAAVVTGVRGAEDALKAKVKAATSKAKAFGVREGMSGEEAIRLLK